jgi:hypothetical protein
MVFGIINALQHSAFALFLVTQQHHDTSNRLHRSNTNNQQHQRESYPNLYCLQNVVSPSSSSTTATAARTTTTTTKGATRLFSTSTSSLVPQPVEKSKYIQLLEWLQRSAKEYDEGEISRSNDAFINDKIMIDESTLGDGYGVFVTNDCSENELLFTIPRSLCVTLNDAINDNDCGTQLKSIMDKAGPGGNTVAMAGYMAKEYLIHQASSSSDESTGSRWGPYFDTLPWKRGINNQEHVLFWDQERIESLLGGSLCYNEACALREEVDLAIRVLGPMVRKPIQKARGVEERDEEDIGFRFPWQADTSASKQNDKIEGLDEAVRGAFVCLLTRSFQDGDGDEEKLVPLLDMLQHSETPNVRHAMRTVDGTVEVRARCDISAGSELWNQYRSEEEESMPYSRFFTRFGFVPGISEPMENLLRDKSSIFYPQVAEV